MTNLDRLRKAMQAQIEGKLEQAETVYLDILKTEPDNPDANHLLGLIRSEQDDNDDAVGLIEKAISLNPDAAPFHHNIAGIYRRMGRLDDAEYQFREAIRLKADYAEAYQGLAEMVKFKKDDPLLDQIRNQLGRTDLESSVRCYFHFAAGKVYDDIGMYDLAFRHYTQGNKDANKPFDSLEFRQRVKDTMYVYSPRYVEQSRGQGHASEVPVFVVGMPRSGTTLVEQILSSHSEVYGAGELNDMKVIVRMTEQATRGKVAYPDSIPMVQGARLSKLGAAYIDRISKLTDRPGYGKIIDKHPLNFQFVGLILTMLPNARIIYTVRHPLDTCLSCFFQNFTKGQHYSFHLDKLAHFYNDCRRLMEHWEMLFPDRIIRVQYEDVLADQENETRRMLAFCDLDFEEQCLQFHKTRRVVKTASFMQVRQPLYKTSKNRWQNYTMQLQQVADILGVPVPRPVTISGSSALTRG